MTSVSRKYLEQGINLMRIFILNELWSKRFLSWILEPVALYSHPRSMVLISLTIFLLGLFFPFFPNHLLKADGTLLSIMGSVMAIFGFDEILVSLGKMSFFSLTWAWIKRFPFPKFKKKVSASDKEEDPDWKSKVIMDALDEAKEEGFLL